MTARANLHLFMAFSAVSSALVPNVALSKENDASIRANGKLEGARQDLAVVVDTLHAKWGSSTELTKALDESQALWRSSVTNTCDSLVDRLHDGGTIRGDISAACEENATVQRAALLRETFRSSLRN